MVHGVLIQKDRPFFAKKDAGLPSDTEVECHSSGSILQSKFQTKEHS